MKLSACVAIVVAMAGHARAETVAQTCFADWWEPTYAPPEAVRGMPATPTVLLPAMWTVRWSGGSGEVEPDFTGLAVEVTAPDGEVVAGELGVGFDIGHAIEPWRMLDVLRRQAWWRATAPLGPGVYEVRLDVADPPSGAETGWCYLSRFERTLTFEVAAEPAPAPVIESAVRFFHAASDSVQYTTDCAGRSDIAWCPNEPTVCCYYAQPQPDLYVFETTLTIRGLDAGGPGYHVLWWRRDSIDDDIYYFNPIRLEHPVPEDEPLVDTQSKRPAHFELPFPPADSLCFDAELTSLATGTVAARAHACVDTRHPGAAAPLPELVCSDAFQCEHWADLGSDPGPDVAVPTEDVGDDPDVTVVEPAESDDGCSSGSTNVAGVLLPALVLMGATLRRTRERAPRMGA